MDPIPGSKEAHEHNQPQTALEEAMLRIATAIEQAHNDMHSLSFFSFGKRLYMRGVIQALKLVFQMLHDLHHKWDNSTGEYN